METGSCACVIVKVTLEHRNDVEPDWVWTVYIVKERPT